ncbi:hypothetical protein KIN20_024975 [Parelaphostrongylus tenuis]|uniref:Uncharacterized protein n=1 Tax=Parelaphostrongylus tenuis TaxID=148309 RepID=A0AAD5MHZ6_PARTN|nr:hypothetical protein KIN20_014209 [Parelaphostrongylus tenuis]KAJ1364803.1 hypothetical protein KIN20_024975 [Parelaphostrongylus tenuis]
MKVIAGPSGLRRITTLRLVATRTAVIPDADDFGGFERRRKATSVPRLQCFENRAIVDLHPEFEVKANLCRKGLSWLCFVADLNRKKSGIAIMNYDTVRVLELFPFNHFVDQKEFVKVLAINE